MPVSERTGVLDAPLDELLRKPYTQKADCQGFENSLLRRPRLFALAVRCESEAARSLTAGFGCPILLRLDNYLSDCAYETSNCFT